MQFSASVSIPVPSTVNVDGALLADNVTECVKSVAELFVAKFGGATVQPANDYYVANDGSLVAESVTIISAFISADNDSLPYLTDFMQNVAQTLYDMWGQECVVYTVGPSGFLAFGRDEQK